MNKEINLTSIIEAIIFWKGEPITVKELSHITKSSEDDIYKYLEELRNQNKNRGISIVEHMGEVAMTTSPLVSEIIENLRKDELKSDISKAGIETLSIILYQGPITRSEIDFIRGVNSQFILRNLLMRGLIEKVKDENDERISMYKPTLSLLSHLGIENIKDLPNFEQIKKEISDFKNTEKDE